MPSSSERETSPSSSATRRRRSKASVQRWAESRWGGPWTALGAIIAGAAALRAVGIQYGLPYDNLLNPDEHNFVLRAWRMVHGGGANPHFFDYPTLLMYVEAPFQAWQDEPSLLAARIVVLVLALGSIAATWWLARRAWDSPLAGAVAAAIVAVCTIHVAYSRESVADVPLMLGISVALGLLVSGRIELAGVAAGLATGFKYPGIFLAVPLVVAGWRQWRRVALGLVLMAAAFAASSPFVLTDVGSAWDDISRVQRWAQDGWLGFEHDHIAPIAFVDRLWEGLGPALIVAGAGLIVALVRRGRTDLIFVSFIVVYFADLMVYRAHFDRYVLPLVPPLAALASRFRPIAPVTLLLLVVPLTWSIRDTKELTRTDTRIVVARWVERNVPAGTRVAADSSTPAFPRLDVLSLKLPGPGRPFDPNRDVGVLRREGIRMVVATGAIADRVLAARDRYPREAAFYDDLVSRAKRLYYVAADDDLAGPWVAIYRL